MNHARNHFTLLSILPTSKINLLALHKQSAVSYRIWYLFPCQLFKYSKVVPVLN